MYEIYASKIAFGQSITPKNAKTHVVILENQENLVEYSKSGGKTAEAVGQFYANLHKELCQKHGPLILTVLTLQNDVVRTREAPFSLVEPLIAKINARLKVKMANTRVIIASTDLAKKLAKKPYDFLNVILPNQTDKHPNIGVRLPHDSEAIWTISVPSWLWAKVGGSVKSEGAGINLLGYIFRAVEALMEGQTEGSIYNQMRAYHTGKIGTYVMVDTLKKYKAMLADMRQSVVLSIDTEGTSLRRVGNTLLSLQVLTAKVRPPEVDTKPTMWFLPLMHEDTPWNGADFKRIKKSLRRFFESECKKQIHTYQFAKFDIHVLTDFLKLRYYSADIYDVPAASFSMEENQKILQTLSVSAYSLEHIEQTFEYTRPPELVIGKADRGRMAEFSLIEIADYGVIDVLTPYYIMCEQIRMCEERGYPSFLTFMLKQLSPMLLAMTWMEHNGIPINMEYLEEIASPMGKLAEQIREAAAKLTNCEAAKKANKLLLKATSYQKKGMFGNAEEPQVWSIRKTQHLQLLFFEVLELDMAGGTLDDGTGALNAAFQKTYRHTPEVKMFTDYQKLNKLKTAFADAIYNFMLNDKDMKHDKRLRPIFKYLEVLTGRASTTKPSTQQIPTHGKNAKIIKGQFEARKGRVLGKADFSAHEVRVSGNLANDDAVCGAVDAVNEALHRFRVANDNQLPSAQVYLDENGDLHVQNYFAFFEIKISKKDPRRQDAKTAVFSVTYGAKEGSVARKMLGEALTAVEDRLIEPSKTDEKKYAEWAAMSDQDKKRLRRQVAYLKSEEAEEEYFHKAKALLKVLSAKWGQLTQYIDDLNKNVAKEHILFGPHGRPRHLWGHVSPDRFVGYAMDRRGFNSMSQGYASDIGFVAMYLMTQAKWELFDSRGYETDILICNAVHDSAMNDLAYAFLPLYVYLQEHAMVTLAEKYYRKVFKIKTRSRYGFDIEAGKNEASMKEWNKRPADLAKWVAELGKEIGASDAEIASCVADAEIIAKLRLKELKSNSQGYHMSLADEDVWESIVPNLNCWDDVEETPTKKAA